MGSVWQTIRGRAGRGTAWFVLLLFIAVSIFPIYWALKTSFTTNTNVVSSPGEIFPSEPTKNNWDRVLGPGLEEFAGGTFSGLFPTPTLEEIQAAGGTDKTVNLFDAVNNSVIVATMITVGQVFFCALAAYAFARLKFRGREALFVVFLSALMVPPIFTALPNFLFIRDMQLDVLVFNIPFDWLPTVDSKTGWLKTHQGLAAPFFLMTPFAIFFLRQFFLGISHEVEEAAILDGAGHVRRFFQIVLPMAAAPIATLAIITYVTAWNEFLWPFLVGGRDLQVITVALNDFKAQTPGTVRPDWSGLMTATFVASVPILLLFGALGRRVVDSIQFSGIK